MAGGYLALALISVLRIPMTGTLRMAGEPVMLAWELVWRLSFAAGMGWIAWHWWSALHREGRPEGGDPRSLIAGTLGVHLAAALALPLTSSDLYSNLAYGHLGWLGFDAYAVGPGALPVGDPFRALVPSPWQGVPSAYGPLLDGFNRLVTLTGSVPVSMAVHKLISFSIVVVSVMVAARITSRFLTGASRQRAFVLLALNPVFVWEISGQSHNDGLMVLAILLGVYFLLLDRTWAALGALVIGALVKVATIPILGLLLCLELRRRPSHGIRMLVTLIGAGAALWGLWPTVPATLAALATNTEVDPYRITNSIAWLIHTAAGYAGSEMQAVAFRTWSAITGLVLLLVGVRAALRTRTPEDLLREALGFLLVLLFLAPQFQPWYIAWILPLAMVSRERAVPGFVALVSILFVAQYPITHRLVGSVTMVFVLWTYVRTPGVPGIPRWGQQKSV